MAKEVRIFWAPSEGKYALSSPFGGDTFLADLRMFCGSDLKWMPKEKLWLFDEDSLTEIIDVVKAHFPSNPPKIEYKPQATKLRSEAEVTSANAAALNMFRVCGPEMGKKVYRFLMLEYHPDQGKHPDHNIAAELTTSWRVVKEALGW